MTTTFDPLSQLVSNNAKVLGLAALCAAAFAFAQSAAATPAADLAAARARWHAGTLASYEYGYRKFCECHPDSPPETLVTVSAGSVVDVRHRPVNYSEEVPAKARDFQFYWTMDGIFDLIHAALDRRAQVRVSYDDKLGYPTQLYIDYDASYIGDELDLKLTHVTAVAPR